MLAYTDDEKVELVEEYATLRHGLKGPWLKLKGIDQKTISTWRKGYLYGDLHRGLIPRDTAGMSVEDGARFQELETELYFERAARRAEQLEYQRERERLEQINQTLGKAIGLLQDHAASKEPMDESWTPTKRRPTKRSSRSRTR